MVQYTLPQSPELLIFISGKDSENARRNALKQIIGSINTGEIKLYLPDGFSIFQLVEISKGDLMAENEDKVVKAVKTLHKLLASKQDVQKLREQALPIRNQIDDLFTDKKIEDKEFNELKKGLKIIEDFAKANLRYKEALPDAEQARSVLDEALKVAEE